jgi:hypothetical protein
LNLHPIVRVACLSLLCGLVLCGCGGRKVAPNDSTSLSEVSKFDPYLVYYAGRKVDGLPFTGISEAKAGQWIYWNFSYGDCNLPSGFFAEGGCSPPLSIQNWSTCYRWANMFARSRNPRGLFDPRKVKAAPARHLFDFRGAKATRGEGGSELEIFTGRTTVVIFAHKRDLAKSVAQQLRGVRQAQTPSLLPPPAPGSLQGKLPCQSKPGESASIAPDRLKEWGGKDSNLRPTDYESAALTN